MLLTSRTRSVAVHSSPRSLPRSRRGAEGLQLSPGPLVCELLHKHQLKRIAESTVRRLSLYLSFLEGIERQGVKTISSDELA
ncbi:MAG TPA: winged-helix domain-containing protein, partial [Gemmatimonadaceae bacterium]|nr:winged-helix domain-containing protein [Gemmatimonadaceae bacterium]